MPVRRREFIAAALAPLLCGFAPRRVRLVALTRPATAGVFMTFTYAGMGQTKETDAAGRATADFRRAWGEARVAGVIEGVAVTDSVRVDC